MGHENVIQAGQNPPHEEQRGNDSQRTRVIWVRGSNRNRFRGTVASNFSSCHVHLKFERFSAPQIESRLGSKPVLVASRWLPPRFRLYSVSEPAGSVLEWNSSDQTAEPIRPIRVGQKHTQHRPAEKLAACSDLRRNREFAQPAIELGVPVLRRDKTFGVVKPGLEREGQILGEEHFRSYAKRRPIVEPVSRLPVPFPLENEDRHYGKSVVGLKEQMIRNQQSFGALQEGFGVLDGRAEVAGSPFPVLDGKGVVTPVPFKTLMAYSECVTVGGGNERPGLRGAAFRRRVVEP